ncbi:hypothetical protein SCP_0902770 [Sparassis crispa]|uniref:Uncharacterized protein n=1 Tax=Sparassis crispa TaxID=139825 RepID=A0A401GVZ0_9APHY|nr:hypothetical protein SCP_0902770 [Sparassis crispa]GBE86398.1 hypothetical protein SCP_0902770 [Sparassis crispa]
MQICNSQTQIQFERAGIVLDDDASAPSPHPTHARALNPQYCPIPLASPIAVAAAESNTSTASALSPPFLRRTLSKIERCRADVGAHSPSPQADATYARALNPQYCPNSLAFPIVVAQHSQPPPPSSIFRPSWTVCAVHARADAESAEPKPGHPAFLESPNANPLGPQRARPLELGSAQKRLARRPAARHRRVGVAFGVRRLSTKLTGRKFVRGAAL